ncbi:MAG: Hsp20/alpha crystallin family protein [Desulfobulbaceae bacterium]|nr:Hsp20/alpha crystallin family protein [Desulfobulbaceae bacterium]
MTDKDLKVAQKQELLHKEETTNTDKYFVPPVDIYETDKEVTVVAEMPGVGSEGVDVSLDADVLTIKGCVEPSGENEGHKVLLHEYDTGHYLRRFTVAETIDQDKISAALNDGLLKITLPKSTPAKPRKIEVRTE